MKYWLLSLDGNDDYIIDQRMQNILQYDRFQRGESFTESWKLLGFVEVKPFGRMSNVITPSEFIRLGLNKSMLFKNGKARYRVVDYDYGHTRVWGKGPKSFFETSGR